MVSLERDANQLGIGILLRGCGGIATVVRDAVVRVCSWHDGAWGRRVVAVGCGFLHFLFCWWNIIIPVRAQSQNLNSRGIANSGTRLDPKQFRLRYGCMKQLHYKVILAQIWQVQIIVKRKPIKPKGPWRETMSRQKLPEWPSFINYELVILYWE